MKLIDAIKNVKRPAVEEDTDIWMFNAPVEDICDALHVERPFDIPDEVNAKLRAYPILKWICTDTHVGLDALYLYDEPVGCVWQKARKEPRKIVWLSEAHASMVREFLLKHLTYDVNSDFDILDPEEDIGEDFCVEYAGESLTDDGYFEGRPVKALIWFDGIMRRHTEERFKREGHAYFVAVAFQDPRCGCVMVQDGDEQRVIPIREFRLALNVSAPASQSPAGDDLTEPCGGTQAAPR